VFTDHPEPFEDSELPALLISTGEDVADYEESGAGALAHHLEVIVSIYGKKASGLQDYLDGINVEVYDQIQTNPTLTGLLDSGGMAWISDNTETTDEAERDIGVQSSTWDAPYFSDPTDPETIL